MPAVNMSDMLTRLQPVWLLILRASTGIMFATSGWGKLNNLSGFITEFSDLGVPAPQVVATLTATAEFVMGLALILGLAARVAAGILALVMIGAIGLEIAPPIVEASTGVLDFASNFFYTPEWLLILVLGVVVTTGAGAFSLDRVIPWSTQLRRAPAA